MSWTLCTSGAAIRKAGAYANANATASGALLADYSDKAEDTFCMKTRKDWVSGFSSIPTHLVGCIADAVSDLIAIKIINYDMSGFTGLNEASTMCDILKDNYNEIIKDLREDQNQKFNK